MNNKCVVIGEETLIYINRRSGITHISIVDTEDLKSLDIEKLSVDNDGYVFYRKNGKTKALHRYLMNTPKGMVVDHINGNKLDNRKNNLRNCTVTENNHNYSVKWNNTSGIKGIKKHKNGWIVHQYFNKKYIYLGYYNDLEKAKQVLKDWHMKFKPYMRWDEA